MDHGDHVKLVRPAIPTPPPGATWADIGAGEGAFTLALADVLGPGASVIAVDRDERALVRTSAALTSSFPRTRHSYLVADFRATLPLPELDGLVAANSLHFVPRAEQVAVVARLAGYIRPGGTFVVVEYDADSGNPWVPYPFSARSWPRLAEAAGLLDPLITGRVPSRFLGAIYSASAQRPRE
ncbi:MAG TPA: class I SAM-dependent methyltransferase [Candidatus Limnocylindrales bacterium]